MSEAVAVTATDSRRTQERALVDEVGGVVRAVDVVDVTGEHAIKFLDGQLSQDVAAMAPGASAWSFVLQPQGKVVALVRVTVVSAEHVMLDTDAGFGDSVLERLNRFRLRVKAELASRQVEVVSVRGARSAGVARPDGLVLDSLWPSWPGWDQLESNVLPPYAVEGSLETWEVARIRVGVPRNGVDLTEKTIPAESGLVPVAASMTKGCYVGQELVARIDSRGHVNRHLRVLEVDGSTPDAGAELVAVESDKAVGFVTSAAYSHLDEHPFALGYVRKEVEPGEVVAVRWTGDEAKARVK